MDYYDESTLIWLEADTIIRRETNDKKSLDDFCRKFHGGENSAPKVVSYNFDDVVAAMSEVDPYDWRAFFTERLTTHGPGAPLAGLENSGWKLVFNDVMNEHQRSEEITDQNVDEQFSLGFKVHLPGGRIARKFWTSFPGSPADRAGLAYGMRVVAVNRRKWSPETLRDAIQNAKTSKEPIEILAESSDYYQTYRIDYHGGERYPHLQAISGKTDVLSFIAQRRAPSAPPPDNY